MQSADLKEPVGRWKELGVVWVTQDDRSACLEACVGELVMNVVVLTHLVFVGVSLTRIYYAGRAQQEQQLQLHPHPQRNAMLRYAI